MTDTADVDEEIQQYNSNWNIAHEQDISFAVDGILRGQHKEYEFPILRDENPISLMSQCHQLLRSNMLSTSAAEYNMTYEDNMNEKRKLVTLEAILDFVQENNEWMPLHKDHIDDNRTAWSTPRSAVIEAIRSHNEYDFALSVLYDERFVSHDSSFCESIDKKDKNYPSNTYEIDADVLANVMDLHTTNKYNSFKEKLEGLRIGMFDIDSRTVGDTQHLCPCPYFDIPESLQKDASKCYVHGAVCELETEISENDILFSTCTSTSEYIEYPRENAGSVRVLLGMHAHKLQQRGLVCHDVMVSNMWGFGDIGNTQNTNFHIDALDILLQGNAGLTPGTIKHVNESIIRLLNEKERIVYTRKGDDQVDNVLCPNQHTNKTRINRLGFPVLTILAESPAMVSCLRFILELSWQDILAKYVPIHANNNNATRLAYAESERSVHMWQKRCAVKLQKLKTCNEQGAFSPSMINAFTSANDLHHDIPPPKKANTTQQQDKCPYRMSIDSTTIQKTAFILDPCIIFHDQKLYDPHICKPVHVFRKTHSNSLIDVHVRDLEENNCEIPNPLHLLSVTPEDEVTSIPLLSKTFVFDLLSTNHSDIRTSGLLGVKRGHDFLFPDENSGDQCFESIPYWPQQWQAPHGEYLGETPRYMSSFSNYVALVQDPNCASCPEEFVVLPNHLKDKQLSQSKFGVNGLCREPVFGMPVVHTDTTSICTSILQDSQENIDTPDIDDTNTEKDGIYCAADSSSHVFGGDDEDGGSLLGFIRLFFTQDPSRRHTQIDLTSTDYFKSVLMKEKQGIFTPYWERTVEDTVRDICTYSQDYGIKGDRINTCTRNQDCYNTHGHRENRACNVYGECEEVAVIFENTASQAIEVGVSGKGCSADEHVSGASPWQRMPGFLHANGMCSHNNAITYERWSHIMTAMVQDGICEEKSVPAGDSRHITYLCPRAKIRWDWVRENPEFWPVDPGMDTNIVKANVIEFLSEIRGNLWGSSDKDIRAFDMQPHLCDSDYMHSSNLGWCGIAQQTSAPLFSYWSRNTDTTEKIALRKNTHRQNKYKDKLRFLGLYEEDMHANVFETNAAAIQQCSELGICETEHFTFNGIQTLRIVEDKIQKVQNIVDCGPTASLDVSGSKCIIDKNVAHLYWALKNEDSACSKMYDSRKITAADYEYSISAQTDLFTFDRIRYREIGTYLNSIFWLDPQYLLPISENNKNEWNDLVHECAKQLHQAMGATGILYGIQDSTPGLYVFLSHGSYEVPVMWWMKYALSRLVFEVTSFIPAPVYNFPLNPFEHRITLQEAHIADIDPSITLAELWARLNTKSQYMDEYTTRLSAVQDMATYMATHFGHGVVDNPFLVLGCAHDMHINHQLTCHDNCDTELKEKSQRCHEVNLYNLFYKHSSTEEGVPIWDPHSNDQTCPSIHGHSVHSRFTEKKRDELFSAVPCSVTPYEVATGANTAYNDLVRLLLTKTLADQMTTYDPKTQELNDFTTSGVFQYGVPVGYLTISQITVNNNHLSLVLKEFDSKHQCNTKIPTFVKTFISPKDYKPECVDYQAKTNCIFDQGTFAALLTESSMIGKMKNSEQPPTITAKDSDGKEVSKIDICKKSEHADSCSLTDEQAGNHDQFYGQTPNADGMLTDEQRRPIPWIPPAGTTDDDDSFLLDPLAWIKQFLNPDPISLNVVIEDEDEEELVQGIEGLDIESGNIKFFSASQNPYGKCNSQSARPVPGNIHKTLEPLKIHDKMISLSRVYNSKTTRADPRVNQDIRCHRVDSTCGVDMNHGREHVADITSIPPIKNRKIGNSAEIKDYFLHKNARLRRQVSYNVVGDDVKDKNAPEYPSGLNNVDIATTPFKKYQCNLHTLSYPSIVRLKAYTLNDFGVDVDVSFAHVVYNDRVLQTITDGQAHQAHAFAHRVTNNVMLNSAPPLSFCPQDKYIETYGYMHYFKVVDYTNIGNTAWKGNQKSFTDINAGNLGIKLLFSKKLEATEYIEDEVDEGGFVTKAGNRRDIETMADNAWHFFTEQTSFHHIDDIAIENNLKNMRHADHCIYPSVTKEGSLHVDFFNLGTCYEYPYQGSQVFNGETYMWNSMTICEGFLNFLENTLPYGIIKYFMGIDIPPKFSMDMFLGPNSDTCQREGYTHIYESTYNSDRFGGGVLEQIFRYSTELWQVPGVITQVLVNVITTREDYLDQDDDVKSWSYLKRLFAGNLYEDSQARLKLNPCLTGLNTWDTGTDTQYPITPMCVRTAGTSGSVNQGGGGGGTPSTLKLNDFPPTFTETYDRHGYCTAGGDSSFIRPVPTIWDEISGNPGKYLVACHPDCAWNIHSKEHCEGCQHILTPIIEATANTDQNPAWKILETENEGVCSYSYELSIDTLFCTTFDDRIDDQDDQKSKVDCDFALPVFGDFRQSGYQPSIWECLKSCTEYDNNVVLQNKLNITEETYTYDHCIGCGIYSTKTTQNYAPLHKDDTEVYTFLEQVNKHIQNMLGDKDNDRETLIGGLNSYLNASKAPFAVRLLSSDGAANSANEDKLVFYVPYEFMVPYDSEITDSFRGFGVNATESERQVCTEQKKKEDESCIFTGFDATYSKSESDDLYRDIEDGCVSETTTDVSSAACNANVSRHLKQLSQYVDDVYKKTFGLKLPRIESDTSVYTRMESSISWNEGVLPFYAYSDRPKTDRDSDYLGYILDTSQRGRCQDTYRNVRDRDAACYQNSAGGVSFVNPWLGGNYSFLKTMQYKRTTGYDSADAAPVEKSERIIDKHNMGLDLCESYMLDGMRHVPCFADTCLNSNTDETWVNRTMCEKSEILNMHIKDELPDKRDRDYLTRLQLDYNLYHPNSGQSLCDIKFKPVSDQVRDGLVCTHTQAPVGFSPPDIRGRVKHAPSLIRNKNAKLTDNMLYKDMFRIRTYKHSSLWHSEPASLLGLPESPLQYVLLALPPDQLAPAFFKLTVTPAGLMKVSSVSLLQNLPSDLDMQWVGDSHVGVIQDISSIEDSALYTRRCRGEGCVSGNWMCAYVDIFVYGASEEWIKQHPTLTLLTPDPVYASHQYPELNGTHPLVRTRQILSREIHDYVLIGLNFVVRRDQLDEWVQNHLEEARRDTLRVMTLPALFNIKKYFSTQTAVMDWPNLNMQLRSLQSITYANNSRFDVSDNIRRAVVYINKFNRIQIHRNTNTNTKRTTRRKYTNPSPASTLDYGGVCNRDTIVRLSSAQLFELVKYPSCNTVYRNYTHSVVECENVDKVSSKNTTRVYTFPLTSFPQQTVDNLYSTHAMYKPCDKDPNNIHNNTFMYFWNANSNNFTKQKIRPEMSTSKRVRMSPLWRFVDRISHLTTPSTITPESIWEHTAAFRLDNQVWTEVNLAVRNTEWSTNWVLQHNSDECKDKPGMGNIPYNRWASNGIPSRSTMCRESLLDVYANSNPEDRACFSKTVAQFDICQIRGFDDFCLQIETIRRNLRDINAEANSYTFKYESLYNPSGFVSEEGHFAWHSVLNTYQGLGLPISQCPAVTGMLQTVDTGHPDIATEWKCPSFRMYRMVKIIEGIRTLLNLLARLVLLVVSLFVHSFMTLCVCAGKEMPDTCDAQINTLLEILIEILDILIDFFILFAKILYDIFVKSFLDFILEIIYVLCNFAKAVVLLLHKILSPIVTFFGGSTDGIDTLVDVADSMNCDGVTDLSQPAKFDGTKQALTGSSCWIQASTIQSPVGNIGSFLSSFYCNSASMCLENTLSTGDATPCWNCSSDANTFMDFGCDSYTQKCVCGKQQVQQPTKCYKNQDCVQAGSLCGIQTSEYALPAVMATQDCLASTGTSICYRHNTISVELGICVVMPHVEMQPCAQLSTSHMLYPAGGLCYASNDAYEQYANLDTMLLHSETVVISCAKLFSSLAITTCRLLKSPYSLRSEPKIVAFSSSANQRRLLSIPPYSTSPLHDFQTAIMDRHLDIPGDCGNIIRNCMLETQTSPCLYCLRIMWFWNQSLSTNNNTTSPLVDTDMMTVKDATTRLLLNPELFFLILHNTPETFLKMARDWLVDTAAMEMLVKYMQLPYYFWQMIVHNRHTQNTYVISRNTSHKHVQTHNTNITSQTSLHKNVHPHSRQTRTRPHTYVSTATDNTVYMEDDTKFSSRRLLQMQENSPSPGLTVTQHWMPGEDSVILDNAALLRKAERPPNTCIITDGVFINEIITFFAIVLEKDGWRAKQACTVQDVLQQQTPLSCPVIEAPLRRVIDNVIFLVKYYIRIQNSNCLVNAAISCLPQVNKTFVSVSSLIPRVRELDKYQVLTSDQGKKDPDIIVNTLLSGGSFMLQATGRGNTTQNKRVLFSFMSTDAVSNDELYVDMVQRNEYSIGRITRDIFSCSLEKVVNCEEKRIPLSLSFVCNFILILIIVTVLPIPSVISFFMWTIGLTIGIWYTSYNFSPTCLPRIPVCFGHDMYELVTLYLPQTVSVPLQLVKQDLCDNRLNYMNITNTGTPCLRLCSEEPFYIEHYFSIFVAIESMLTRGSVSFMRNTYTIFSDYIHIPRALENLEYFERIFSEPYNKQLEDAILFCIFTNLHKILIVIFVLSFVSPAIVYIVTSLIQVVFVLFSHSINTLYEMRNT